MSALRGLVVGVLLLLVASLAGCGSSGPSELVVSHAWARTTPTGATEGVVYLTVESPDDDTLLAASVPPQVASLAELHESMLEPGDGGMPDMPGMDHSGGGASGTDGGSGTGAVEVPAGSTVAFEPGGRHVMLVGLAQPLEEGQAFPLTLSFEVAGERTVEVAVATNAP